MRTKCIDRYTIINWLISAKSQYWVMRLRNVYSTSVSRKSIALSNGKAKIPESVSSVCFTGVKSVTSSTLWTHERTVVRQGMKRCERVGSGSSLAAHPSTFLSLSHFTRCFLSICLSLSGQIAAAGGWRNMGRGGEKGLVYAERERSGRTRSRADFCLVASSAREKRKQRAPNLAALALRTAPLARSCCETGDGR